MKLYNTLTKKKEEFVPIEEGKVKKCTCADQPYTTSFTLVTHVQ